MLLVFRFYCAPSVYSKEERYVLILLPLITLITGIGVLLLGLLAYPFMDFKSAFWTAKPLPWYPLWVSVAATVGFTLSWLSLIFGKYLFY